MYLVQMHAPFYSGGDNLDLLPSQGKESVIELNLDISMLFQMHHFSKKFIHWKLFSLGKTMKKWHGQSECL
jgi:hypothetical protein